MEPIQIWVELTRTRSSWLGVLREPASIWNREQISLACAVAHSRADLRSDRADLIWEQNDAWILVSARIDFDLRSLEALFGRSSGG